MPRLIIKCDRDEDLYVEWSTMVDNAIAVGDRAETLAALVADWDREHPQCVPKPGYGPEDRLKRADELGSTAMPEWGEGHWDDKGFIGEQRGWLPRTSLLAYARALLADDQGAADALLELLDPEGE
jgi:hypothetical protein